MTEASNSLPTDGLLNEVNDEFSGLTLALSKGRILEETMPLLRAAGVELLEDPEASRKLIFPTSNPNVRVLILRASDVPTYVEHGAADFGVAGKDVLLEHGANHVYELLDLQIAQCKLMTAGVKGAPLPNRRLRIATKYVNVARAYFANQGQQVDVIKLYGSMELAPLVGLGDLIVDVVDTGNTLLINGMRTYFHKAIFTTGSYHSCHQLLNLKRIGSSVGRWDLFVADIIANRREQS